MARKTKLGKTHLKIKLTTWILEMLAANSTKLVIINALLLLASCGPQSYETHQHVVLSTPGVCSNGFAPGLHFCTNTSEVNDYVIKPVSSCNGTGTTVEWGITRVVTTTILTPVDIADGCNYDVIEVHIESEVPDPIGTQYRPEVGSFYGGLQLKRVSDDNNWYTLRGYQKPVYCDSSLCSGITTEDFSGFPRNAQFELVLIDNKREIEIVPW